MGNFKKCIITLTDDLSGFDKINSCKNKVTLI